MTTVIPVSREYAEETYLRAVTGVWVILFGCLCLSVATHNMIRQRFELGLRSVRQVSPSETVLDLRYLPDAYSKTRGQSRQRFLGVPDFVSLRLCDLVARVGRTEKTNRDSMLVAVSHVVCVRSRAQVFRIDASARITKMSNNQTLSDRTFEHFIGPPMRHIAARSIAENPVPAPVYMPVPQPAFAALRGVRHESAKLFEKGEFFATIVASHFAPPRAIGQDSAGLQPRWSPYSNIFPDLYEVTAYSHGCTLPRSGGEKPPQRGADGRWPRADITVAADEALHPFGSELLIAGLGFRTVGDRGHAIKGRRLDLFVDTCKEARKFGRRWLSVVVVPSPTSAYRGEMKGMN